MRTDGDVVDEDGDVVESRSALILLHSLASSVLAVPLTYRRLLRMSGNGCLDVNHSLWSATVKRAVVPDAVQDGIVFSAVDYAGLMLDSADLTAYLEVLAAVNTSALSEVRRKRDVRVCA